MEQEQSVCTTYSALVRTGTEPVLLACCTLLLSQVEVCQHLLHTSGLLVKELHILFTLIY